MSKLLIVADVEGSCSATPRGLQLAELMDLQPEVVAFVYADLKRLKLDAKSAASVKKQLMDQRRSAVTAEVEKFAGSNRRVKVQVVWAEAIHDWIIKRAGGDYAGVVKTRHKSESFGHTSTDWHLLRQCSAPVLLVSKRKWRKGGLILATVDLDAGSKTKQALNVDVVTTARHYAEMLETELLVLCVIDVPTLLNDLDLVDPRKYAKAKETELRPTLEKLAEQTGLPLSRFKVKRGPVAKTIVSEAADKKAQLVVMGTVGRRGVRAQVLGNTAEEVLGLLRADTLTLKP